MRPVQDGLTLDTFVAEFTRGSESEERARARRMLGSILAMLGYQGFAASINGIGAPWIARSFGLDQSGIAALFAWISLSAIGALGLSRMVDRVGRRRILLVCIAATPICALAAAAATRLVPFTIVEIFFYAFIGATVSGSVVMLAEELPIAQRARGQSLGGLALALGGGVAVLSMPMLDHFGLSWRWMLVLAGAGIAGFPRIAKLIPESRRWEHANASGATSRGSFREVFAARYRRRSIPLLVWALLTTIASSAALSWGYYHAVAVVKLSAAGASGMMIAGGGVGLAGFALAARACERWGRVPTIVAFDLMVAAGALFFYWGPPEGFASPWLWLTAAYCGFTMAQNGATVSGNSIATELLPTAIRGTMFGWLSLIAAAASVGSQSLIAMLAGPLGGLSNVVGYLSLLIIPSLVILALMIPETRGLSLEAAAQES